jgi:hypothetical protein
MKNPLTSHCFYLAGVLLFALSSVSYSQSTVITVTNSDGNVATHVGEQPMIAQVPNSLLDPIAEGGWMGSNDVSFTVLNQTSIDTFGITFRDVGGCSGVTVKTYPVAISGNSFTVNYDIPTISAGSLTGTFSSDGRQCNGTFSYTNYHCGGSASGSWSAEPTGSTLFPPRNLHVELSGPIVTLNWDAPAASAMVLAQLRPTFPKPFVLKSVAMRHTPDVGNNMKNPMPSITSFIAEVEPNNDLDQAQIITGVSPVTIDGSAELTDEGVFIIEFEGGATDDLEDLFVVTTQSPGLNLALAGASSDLDLYLLEASGDTIEILDESLATDC